MRKKKKGYLSYADFHDHYPKFNLGTLVVAICCTCMLISSSFIQLLPGIVTIPEKLITDPINFFNSGFSLKQFALSFNYLPQVPVALFIGALLGPRHGTFAVILYILIALLGYPVFSMGGGFDYITNPSFGYIIGFIFGAYIVGKNLEHNVSTLSIFLSSVIGVLTIHIIGILFLMLALFIHKELVSSILGYIWLFTGIQFIYDIAISIIAISIARPVRGVLWLAMN